MSPKAQVRRSATSTTPTAQNGFGSIARRRATGASTLREARTLDDSPTLRRLEELGVAQVTLMLSTGAWPQSLHMQAVCEASLFRRAARSLSANTIAREASSAAARAAAAAEQQALAAERANTRATLALILSVISVAVTIGIAVRLILIASL
jgi:hypothetical protein